MKIQYTNILAFINNIKAIEQLRSAYAMIEEFVINNKWLKQEKKNLKELECGLIDALLNKREKLL